MKNHIKEFINIPETGFISSEEIIEEQQVLVRNRIKAKIVFSGPALMALVFGAGIWGKAMEHVSGTDLVLLSKIAIGEIGELTRNEMNMLRQWLEARIAHCEAERDQRSERFNPDTYIMMKMLLLDIREWLLGEVVS